MSAGINEEEFNLDPVCQDVFSFGAHLTQAPSHWYRQQVHQRGTMTEQIQQVR